ESTLNSGFSLQSSPLFAVTSVTSAVSMEAHYRDPVLLHKCFLDLFFRSLSFYALRRNPVLFTPYMPLFPLADG
ncbi:hypothetical protein, partial [Shimwellia pseudoproteus]|uniref:hypothetical protein n=1 Tax=Shimwellia pseudoproteus TaxID=570012 RepID=UPI001E644B24